MTILPTLIQSVAHPPRDGKQLGSERTLSPEPVQAATFPNQRRIVSPLLSSLAARGADESAAPFPHPHANPSLRAVTQASNGSPVPPFLFDDPCLSAQMAMGIS